MDGGPVFETVQRISGESYIVALDPQDSGRSALIERIGKYTWSVSLDDIAADFHALRLRDSKVKAVQVARRFLVSHAVAEV